jgi:LysM repeat protein
MATVTVRLPSRPRPPARHPHVTIVSAAGSVTVGATNPQADIDGLGASWTQIQRPGTNALLRRATRNRMEYDLSVFLVDGYGGKTIEQQILALDAIGASKATCGVSFGEMANHRWQLTAAKGHTSDRAPITNKALHAEFTLTFVVAVDEGLTVPVPRRKTPPSNKPKGRRKTITVRKGDTLSKIAAREYGNANRWPEIAKLNKLRNPGVIKVGQKLVV